MDTVNANKMPHIDSAIEAKPYRIKLLIQAVYDVFPSLSKFFCSGKVDSPACHLCLGRRTLEHIFSCCPKALGEGCCLWCHEQVPKAIANTICSGISLCKHFCPESTAFVRAAQKITAADWTTSTGLLATTQDLELKVDLGNQLPSH